MSIREGLLSLLLEGPKYGYQLKSDFEEQTGKVWPINVGQVYTTLDRLTRDECVVAGGTDNEGRTLYSITTVGRKEVEAWFATAVADSVPPRDELMIKVLFAIAADRVDAREVIDAQRAGLLAALRHHRRRQQAAGEQLLDVLLFDALIARVESDLRWLEVCEQRLISATKKGRKS